MTIKNTESGAVLRTKLSKGIVLSIRTLMQQSKPDEVSKDLAAYVVLSLRAISRSVDEAAQAWEKRDYWVKADNFRAEFLWIDMIIDPLEKAVREQNWAEIVQQLMTVATKFGNVKIAEKHRIGQPWLGAWILLQRKANL